MSVIKDSFFGSKNDLNEILNEIENVRIFNDNAIQIMLQIVAKELDIKVKEDRKLWLYNFKEI
jgi:hypothetical protein